MKSVFVAHSKPLVLQIKVCHHGYNGVNSLIFEDVDPYGIILIDFKESLKLTS